MVADADHTAAALCWRADCHWRKLRCSALHLHTVLTGTVQSNERFKTLLVIVTGLLALAWIFSSPLLEKIAFAIGVISLAIPAAARFIEWAWMKLATGLGWLNSRIVLTVVYFLFLMPLAWISRLFTRDPMALKKGTRSTLFVTRDHLYTKKDLENIW